MKHDISADKIHLKITFDFPHTAIYEVYLFLKNLCWTQFSYLDPQIVFSHLYYTKSPYDLSVLHVRMLLTVCLQRFKALLFLHFFIYSAPRVWIPLFRLESTEAFAETLFLDLFLKSTLKDSIFIY